MKCPLLCESCRLGWAGLHCRLSPSSEPRTTRLSGVGSFLLGRVALPHFTPSSHEQSETVPVLLCSKGEAFSSLTVAGMPSLVFDFGDPDALGPIVVRLAYTLVTADPRPR